MELDALEVKNNGSFVVRFSEYSNLISSYSINGRMLTKTMNGQKILIDRNDVFLYHPSKKLDHYAKGDEVMSCDEWNSKPTYYDDDTSEENVLRRIANRKEKEGFEPVYITPEPVSVEFNIIGYLENTGSRFVHSSIGSDRMEAIYTIYPKKIAMDEYKLLEKVYEGQAVFNNYADRNYLRFAKINNSFAFADCYPFSECSRQKTYTSLSEAQKEEQKIRDVVNKYVDRAIKGKQGHELSQYKCSQIADRLALIHGLSDKKSIKEAIRILQDDLRQYMSIIPD